MLFMHRHTHIHRCKIPKTYKIQRTHQEHHWQVWSAPYFIRSSEPKARNGTGKYGSMFGFHNRYIKRKCCGHCNGCQAEDCGICKYCIDNPRFGGPGRKKQCCVTRKCTNMKSTSPNQASEIYQWSIQLREHLAHLLLPQGTNCSLLHLPPQRVTKQFLPAWNNKITPYKVMEIVCFDHCQRSYLEVRSTT